MSDPKYQTLKDKHIKKPLWKKSLEEMEFAFNMLMGPNSVEQQNRKSSKKEIKLADTALIRRSSRLQSTSSLTANKIVAATALHHSKNSSIISVNCAPICNVRDERKKKLLADSNVPSRQSPRLRSAKS